MTLSQDDFQAMMENWASDGKGSVETPSAVLTEGDLPKPDHEPVKKPPVVGEDQGKFKPVPIDPKTKHVKLVTGKKDESIRVELNKCLQIGQIVSEGGDWFWQWPDGRVPFENGMYVDGMTGEPIDEKFDFKAFIAQKKAEKGEKAKDDDKDEKKDEGKIPSAFAAYIKKKKDEKGSGDEEEDKKSESVIIDITTPMIEALKYVHQRVEALESKEIEPERVKRIIETIDGDTVTLTIEAARTANQDIHRASALILSEGGVDAQNTVDALSDLGMSISRAMRVTAN